MTEAQHNYGPFRAGQDYKIIKEGFDWYLIAIGGKAVYSPKWVFED